MIKHLLKIRLIISFCIIAFYGSSFSQTHYTIIDLDSSGQWLDVRTLNDSTQLAGTTSQSAFVWAKGVVTTISSLAGKSSVAHGLNNNSIAIGQFTVSAGVIHGFKYDNGIVTDLQTLGGAWTIARGINDAKQIAGFSNIENGQYRAFIWENGVMHNLETLGGNSSTGYAINNLGQVVGSARTSDGTDEAFIWGNNVMTDLGVYGIGYAVNDLSQVAGAEYGIDGHAFLWDNGTVTDLQTLGGQQSWAYGINNLTQIVGTSTIADGSEQAFIWQNGSMTDLNTLIDSSNWILRRAYDINEKGEIVGFGIHNGAVSGFLLKPKSLFITKPQAGEHFIAGEPDTIKWTGGEAGQLLQIEFSTDSGRTFNVIDFSIAAGTGIYLWNVPDSILSAKCMMRIFDMIDSSKADTSALFRIKGYVLTRTKPDGSYEQFKSSLHGWNLLNGTLWPQSWWSQFNYASGNDPITNKPYPYFLQYVNSSSFVDWPLWVDVFTEDKCYWSVFFGIYKEDAELKWGSITRVPTNTSPQGSCFGFASTSLLAFNYSDQFFGTHPGIPNVPNIFSLFLNNTILKTINTYFAYQYGKQTYDNDVTGQRKDARTTLKELKTMLSSDNPDVSTISIYNNGGGGPGAHTMAPIRLKKDSSGPSRYRLFLYDSNNPGVDTFYILIDSVNNTWRDFTGLGATWTGVSHFYLEIPISNYLNTQVMGKKAPKIQSIAALNNIEFYNNEKSSVIYTSSAGKKIGFNNGAVTNQFENGIAIFNKNGRPSDPIGYYLPDDSYSIEMKDIKDTIAYLSCFKKDIIYNFKVDNSDPDQIDNFRIDDGFSAVSRDVKEKQINIAVVSKVDSTEKILEMRQTQLKNNDSLYIRKLNQNDFIIKNFGTSKTYGLVLNERSSEHEKIFQSSIDLQANSSQLLKPAWEDLNESELNIEVDLGNDGTIDDTIKVINTTDAGGKNKPRIPKEFNLEQNFPNPFNPSTTIAYQIPAAGFVSLKVYNIIGQEIANLVNEEKPAGIYSIAFNAAAYPSGIYIYSLRFAGKQASRKMVLIK
ncbi:MAG TPA: T9SS type A sorting domain-containing protein [Ignavibacteriaceae bacterium]|nr:T9SS type A sorting domain-containing protein [Ignavibacteriaceae bacterium]